MAKLQLFDQLLQFPLFLGMSRSDLETIVGQTRLDFQKVAAHVEFVKADAPCTHLLLLLSGTFVAERQADDGSYQFAERLTAPLIVEPEVLFGYHQRYTHTYRAATTVNLLRIERQEVVRLTEQFMIFRINLLNLLSTGVQKHLRQAWRRRPETVSDRVVRFFAQHVVYPAGPKTVRILMTQLGSELGCSRLDVSVALNEMQRQCQVELHRGRIEIPQMERLLMAPSV